MPISNPNHRRLTRATFIGLAIVAAAAITGCNMMKPQSSLVAMSTQLRAANEVPPNSSAGSGSVDAVFDKSTNQLRWKVNYADLTGPASAGHFHGPAAVGANAGVALPWKGPVTSPIEGSATLTQPQADDLLAGKWYANIHTAANPGGELRGQMMVRN